MRARVGKVDVLGWNKYIAVELSGDFLVIVNLDITIYSSKLLC